MKYLRGIAGFLALMFIATSAHAIAMSNYWENKLVDELFRATPYSVPATLYVGLSTAACSDTGVGTEVTGGSYARVAVVSATTAWNGTHGTATGASSGTNGTVSNVGVITFPAPTASWGVVTHFFVSDAASAGNILFCSALTVSKTINNGDSAPSFAAGSLTFQIDN